MARQLLSSLVRSRDTLPTGAILPYGGAVDVTEPDGFFLCDGAAKNRITEGDLFAVIGTAYGVGDGSTTFNLPDFRTSNRVPMAGTDDSERGDTGGESTVTLTGAESGIAEHSHAYTGVGSVSNGVAGNNTVNITSAVDGLTTAITGNTNAVSAHENKPPFQKVNYIIKK